MRNVSFVLKGEMPLLMSADDVFAADDLKVWRTDPANKNLSVAGDDRSPAWTWQTRLYHDGKYITMPADNVMACLRKAGAGLTMKKQTSFKSATQSGLLISKEFCDFYVNGKQVEVAKLHSIREKPFADHCKTAEALGFKLFVKRAKPDGAKGKHVRVRPRFDTWEIRGQMEILVPEITIEVLTTIFNLAGRVGLGDWRPSAPKSPGPYGMFTAEVKAI